MVRRDKIKKKRSWRLKGLPVGLLVMVIGSVLVLGAMLTYFVSIQVDVTVEALWEYSDDGGSSWDTGESLDVLYTCSLLGGENWSKDFKLRLNGNASSDCTAYFDVSVSPDNTSGVTAAVYNGTVPITSITVVPGATEDLSLVVDAAHLTPSGSYQVDVVIT